MKESPEENYKIKFEIQQIQKEIEIIEILKNVLMNGELDEIQLRAAGSTLHSIYNGIEKILLLKIKEQKIEIELNKKWHTELLIKAVENKIISKKIEEELREIMGFRHFFRHAYGFMINKNNIEPLIKKMKYVFEDFSNEINKK